LNHGGHGILNMIRECLVVGLLEPRYYYDMSGFGVELRNDIYNGEYL